MLKPIEDRIVVEKEGSKESVRGGIYVPETAGGNARYQSGVVVAVGPGKYNANGDILITPNIKVGQKIAFSSLAGVPIMDGDKEYVVIHYSDIFVIFE